MQTILSPNYHAGRQKPIRLVVIHDMESPETATTAEQVARYFARPSVGASAHVCADNDSRVRCVADASTAWAAPGANADGLQLELAGYARQSFAGWMDDYSEQMLRTQAAPQVREWCVKYLIPMRRLSNEELAAGEKGIVGHRQVSQVYKRSTHSDPGEGFPWSQFIAMVRDDATPARPIPKEDEMTPAQEEALRKLIVDRTGSVFNQVNSKVGAAINEIRELKAQVAGLEAVIASKDAGQ